MGETMGEHDFGDFFTREFSDFAEDGPGGGNFRGRGGGGGGPWRGGRGGRGGGGGGGGHFNDNGFGFGGPRGGPRFRGGRGGFMGGPNMRGGPGPRGPGPGFRGGHFERPFRPPGGGWNGPPGHNMGHGGGGNGNEFMSPGGGSDSQDLVIWAETKTDTGSLYYYNTKTRSTSWDRPEGPGIKIMSHEEWSVMMAGSGENPRFNEHESPEINKPGFDQGPPQGPGNFAPRPNMGGPNPGNPMQGPPSQQVRPPGNLGPPPSVNPFTAALGQTQNPFRPPGPVNPFSSPGENGFSGGQDDKDESGNLHKPPAVPVGMPPQQRPPMMAPQQGPPGFPPFPSMTSVPPPFGLSFPQNFPMVPPPWNPMSGVPPPTGVPPPMMNPVDPVLQHIDPQVVARAFEWSEHMSPDGKPYYFNAKTQASVWEKPPPMVEYETAKAIAQQRVVQQAMMNATKEKLTDSATATSEPSKSKEAETRRSSSGDKCRPVSSTPVTGTPWCVVWTGDKRVFFYNPSTKTSVWERPQDLIGRMDVEEMLRNIPSTKNIPPASVKKAEATSTTESANSTTTGGSAVLNANQTPVVPANTNSEKSSHTPESVEVPAIKADWAGKLDTKIVINLEKRGRDKDEISIGGGAPPEKKPKTEDNTSEDGSQAEVITIGSDDEKQEEQKAALQEKNALEAEVLAARERAVVPLETRLQQFREMLVEKQVSAFSVWEKELHKIVFDSRYLLLTSKERKTAFENYVKERAEEERKEKKTRLKVLKEKFLQFLEDVSVSPKMTYNEFAQKHGRDERYKIIEKSRDREAYFIEYQSEIKRKEKESRSHKKDKVKDDFTLLLKERIKDYHVKWADVRKKFDESRYDILDPNEKEELFRVYQKKLKAEMKYKEKKKKKKLKKQKREKLRSYRTRTESKSERDPNEEEQAEVDTEESVRTGDVESDKMEDVSDEEEREEGAISDDSEEDQDDVIERARKERAEISMREREREVQRTLATHLRDRDKEREFYRHEEAVQDFQAQLTDIVRSSDMSWKDAKKLLKKDPRWGSVGVLSREEMEDFFTQHIESIARKKKLRFRDLLVEARVKLNSNWRDVRKKVRDDPRFQKYSADERKCEREFSMYLKDLATQMKSDFRALLKETKMLNYKSKLQIRENPQILKDVEALLEKDKRFLNLDCMADERQRLLAEYLDELERKGPPPPPTASEPSRRLK